MSIVPVTLRKSFFSDKFFESAWQDFEKIRQDMLQESREFWEQAEKNRQDMMRDMSLDMNTSATSASSSSKMSSSSTSERKSSREESSTSKDLKTKDLMSFDHDDFFAPWFFPRRWMMPSVFFGDSNSSQGASTEVREQQRQRFAFPSEFFSSLNNDEQMIQKKNDDKKFEVSLDTHDYRPEEIKVNIVGNVVNVEGKHEEKSENKFVSRQFSRKYTLPEECLPEKVSSNLSSDGILMITAPKREQLPKIEDGKRSVPITMKN